MKRLPWRLVTPRREWCEKHDAVPVSRERVEHAVECERQREVAPDSKSPSLPIGTAACGEHKDRNECGRERQGMGERPVAAEPVQVAQPERSADCVDVEQHGPRSGDSIQSYALGWVEHRAEGNRCKTMRD